MALPINDLERLSTAITGRRSSAFEIPMATMREQFLETFRGARILITGGAGFIAGQALRVLLPMEPSKVVVVDTNENALAELVRDLRVEGAIPAATAFEPRLLDVTGPLVRRLVEAEGPFDSTLAFAAAKHVRSERDPLSALHMLNVNVTGTARVADAVMDNNPQGRLFVVSTDKAADPSSLMGASKRIMEMVVLGEHPGATSTRFANVAFSSGSLLESWLVRMARGQLLSVPADTSRFFVSPAEAGHLCVLACMAPMGRIAVPADGVVTSVDLLAALRGLLGDLGLGLTVVQSIAEAADVKRRPNSVVALVTARDTAGEKAEEVFVGLSESASAWLPGIDAVTTTSDPVAAREFSRWVTSSLEASVGPDLEGIVERIHATLPSFQHVHSVLRLDDRI